jgi:hypothetical protein
VAQQLVHGRTLQGSCRNLVCLHLQHAYCQHHLPCISNLQPPPLPLSVAAYQAGTTFVLLRSGALEAMFALGWVHDEANAEELVVRKGTYFSMKEVSGTPGMAFACDNGGQQRCVRRGRLCCCLSIPRVVSSC